MYTPEQMKNIVRSSLHYKLTASSKFWWGEYDDLAKVCNGCGPEDGPNSRNILTVILQRYAPVWAIHDVDYEFHTCTREEADKRMYDNMIAVWRKDFGFWRWLSFSGIFNRVIVIPAAYTTVSKFGKDAWDNIKGVKYERRTGCDDMCDHTDMMHDEGTKIEPKNKANTTITACVQGNGKDKSLNEEVTTIVVKENSKEH